MPFHQLHPKTRTYGTIRPRETRLSKKQRLTNFFSWRRIKQITLFFAIFSAILFIGGTTLTVIISRDLPDPNKLTDRQIAESTKIYDRTGTHLLYEVYQGQKRTVVDLTHISSWAQKATIAVEDRHFYDHNGIRVTSILRAAISNVLGLKSGSGGASTLTQQLIKNAVIGNEHSLFRKIKEAVLAIKLERTYSKNDILKLYLNEIPYGSTNYGIESASQSYFHKSAQDLTLAEAATLAGMVQSPSRYLNNTEALKDRRNTVLYLMTDQGYITEAERAAAEQTPVKLFRGSGIAEAPHFVLYVKQQLADRFGEETIDRAGYKVITTLDYDKQKIAATTIKELGDKFAAEYHANNAALVAMDPKTGEILSLVGSRDFFNDDIDGQFNVAILGKRQPGSSLKPFVYAAAWERGFTPETVLYDVTTNFDLRSGSGYTPKNANGKNYGLITMMQALQGSLNIPAVKTLYMVGVQDFLNFASQRFGYTTLSATAGLSLVLGGSEVNLLEHTTAYGALANNGVFHPAISILRIEGPDGKIIFEQNPTPGTIAIAPDLAATVARVLSDNSLRAYIFGTNNTLVLPGRPVATKTGTTNDNKDAWTMGYTPSLVTGVWVGNTIPSPMVGGGSKLAGEIWNRFMTESLKGTPAELFPTAPVNTATKAVLRGATGGIRLPIDLQTGRIASSSTPPEFVQEQTFLPPHDILFYVDKNNPAGPLPTHPEEDPQFAGWEAGLQAWAEKQNAAGTPITFSDPPNDSDPTFPTSSPSTPELLPSISFVSPTPNFIFTNQILSAEVLATAPRGVDRVIYSVDGKNIFTATSFPFSLLLYNPELSSGPHTLRAIASDDLNNSQSVEVQFTWQSI